MLTALALTVATVSAMLQYALPAMVPALQRDSEALVHGQWWRLVTPLLVQTLGLHQVLANLTTLALIGVATEQLLGRGRWLLLFAAGTTGGQAAAYAWHEPGGGASIAICGLAGGVTVALLACPGPLPTLVVNAIVYYVVALTGWGLNGIRGAAAGCVIVAVLSYSLRRLGVGVRGVDRAVLACAIACAVVLAAIRDLHGISLSCGIAAMIATIIVERRGREPRQ